LWIIALVLVYRVSSEPTPEGLAEYQAFEDLRLRYRVTELRRFIAEDDLD
jgi:hypothetical protein